jgi:PadR family transcriptional regulator, regulatory protein PadR
LLTGGAFYPIDPPDHLNTIAQRVLPNGRSSAATKASARWAPFARFDLSPVDNQKGWVDTPVDYQQEDAMGSRADIMQGTLDLMVLRTLETLGPLHGWGIAQRLEQVSEEALRVNQGTLYPALLRLEQRGLIRSRWGMSENNRRARFYSLTAAGRRQLDAERAEWRLLSGIINRLLAAEE